jgi:hypothetical protein
MRHFLTLFISLIEPLPELLNFHHHMPSFLVRHMTTHGSRCLSALVGLTSSRITLERLPFNQTSVFLGYSSSYKDYKCLDVSTGRVYISRDIVFDEGVFPFANLHPNAGAQLCVEISLLPPPLRTLTEFHGNDLVVDHMANGSNHVVESRDVQEISSIGMPPSNDAAVTNSSFVLHATDRGAAMNLGKSSSVGVPNHSHLPATSASAGAPNNHLSTTSSMDPLPASGSGSPLNLADKATTVVCLCRHTHIGDQSRSDVVGGSVAISDSASSDSSVTTMAVLDLSSVLTTTRSHTRLQDNIVRPKKFTNGIVRYDKLGLISTWEPKSLDDALSNEH